MDERDDEYRLAVEPHPTYMRATVTGPRTPDNARRFLKESFAACVRAGRDALLLEMRLEGPSLDPSAIFGVISGGAPDGQTLRRIAYVDPMAASRTGPAFATMVATNRGVNVRLFGDVSAAEAWLRSEP
jgi:hypothetical protein